MTLHLGTVLLVMTFQHKIRRSITLGDEVHHYSVQVNIMSKYYNSNNTVVEIQ